MSRTSKTLRRLSVPRAGDDGHHDRRLHASDSPGWRTPPRRRRTERSPWPTTPAAHARRLHDRLRPRRSPRPTARRLPTVGTRRSRGDHLHGVGRRLLHPLHPGRPRRLWHRSPPVPNTTTCTHSSGDRKSCRVYVARSRPRPSSSRRPRRPDATAADGADHDRTSPACTSATARRRAVNTRLATAATTPARAGERDRSPRPLPTSRTVPPKALVSIALFSGGTATFTVTQPAGTQTPTRTAQCHDRRPGQVLLQLLDTPVQEGSSSMTTAGTAPYPASQATRR